MKIFPMSGWPQSKCGHRYSLQNRACVGVKILKHHLRSRLHLLVAYGFRLIQGVSHNIKH
jgi:hypothetical protein